MPRQSPQVGPWELPPEVASAIGPSILAQIVSEVQEEYGYRAGPEIRDRATRAYLKKTRSRERIPGGNKAGWHSHEIVTANRWLATIASNLERIANVMEQMSPESMEASARVLRTLQQAADHIDGLTEYESSPGPE